MTTRSRRKPIGASRFFGFLPIEWVILVVAVIALVGNERI